MFLKIYYYLFPKRQQIKKTKIQTDTEFDTYIKYDSVWL